MFQGNKNYFHYVIIAVKQNHILEGIKYPFFKQEYTTLFNEKIIIYCLTVSSKGFLYKMIRHIVGSVLHSMQYFININKLYDYFVICRPLKYELAPAQGLHLTGVYYNNE